ncbi:MAG: NUDIX domain-containing protein [Actinobacteria bacterium]|nr:NUDIX domain-containing protein [Actinomycetota bacterium]MBI3688011.1 NUDIX domain-containing protein [Actinomycetota bacterium]
MRPAVTIVVGVVLYDGRGRLLAARRREGGWEFPGGKVEPGETERAAAVRECAEELGVRVRLSHRLPGSQPCGSHHLLRVFTGRIVEGDPAARVHAELCWVDRAQVAALEWLPADRPFLPVVVERLRVPRLAVPRPAGEPGPAR